MPESALPATGILLAGGKSSRMKRNKAFLEFAGRPLVERSLEVLLTTFKEVIISTNDPELYAKYSVQIVPDLILHNGPLSGIYSSLQAATYDECFFVACDMPFLYKTVIRYMAQWVHDFDIVVPQSKQGLHPLHAYYKRSCLPYIEKNLKAKNFKIIDFYPDCQVRYVTEKELKIFGDTSEMFCNVNTPAEWEKVIQS